jgi:hypothetical protein
LDHVAASNASVLQYASRQPARKCDVVAGAVGLALSVPAIGAIILIFDEQTSPWDVIRNYVVFPPRVTLNGDNLVLVAAPFLLAFVLAWLGIRSLMRGRISTSEVVAVRSVGGLSACATLYVLWLMTGDLKGPDIPKGELATFAGVFVILLAGMGAAIVQRRKASAYFMAIYVPYLANALLCLVCFGPPSNIGTGWYVTLGVAGAIFLEIVRLCFLQRRESPSERAS